MKRLLGLMLTVTLLLAGCATYVPQTINEIPSETYAALPTALPVILTETGTPPPVVPFRIWISNPSLVLPTPDCPVLAAIAEKYGLRFILEKSHQDAQSELDKRIAQGDPPQAFCLTDEVLFLHAKESGYLQPLTDYLQFYAPKLLSETLSAFLPYIADEGTLWYLPIQYAKGGIENLYPETGLGVHIRSDLLQGSTQSMQTWQDVFALLRETQSPLVLPLFDTQCVRDLCGIFAGSFSLSMSEDGLYQDENGMLRGALVQEDFSAFLQMLRREAPEIRCPLSYEQAMDAVSKPCVLAGDSWNGLGQTVADATDTLLVQSFPTIQGMDKPTYLPYSIGLYRCGTCISQNITGVQCERFFHALECFSREEGHLDILGLIAYGEKEKGKTYDYETDLSVPGQDGRMTIVPTKDTLEGMAINPNYAALRGQNALSMLTYGSQNDPDGYYDVVGNPAQGQWSQEMLDAYALLGWTEENYFPRMRAVGCDVTPLRDLADRAGDKAAALLEESLSVALRYLPELLTCEEENYAACWQAYTAALQKTYPAYLQSIQAQITPEYKESP